jgi:hypoxia up-regulated 1
VAEQAKLPATEKPVLLSKDIEAKMMSLDREVQYLLNKAKFAKPRARPKDKNGTRTEPPLNASATDQGEKIIPPAGEGRCWASDSKEQGEGLHFLLRLHLSSAFPPGQTEEAQPISEPEKVETGELGKPWLGTGHFISLG